MSECFSKVVSSTDVHVCMYLTVSIKDCSPSLPVLGRVPGLEHGNMGVSTAVPRLYMNTCTCTYMTKLIGLVYR